MTKVVFYKSDDTFYGFEELGHTGYGESGDDVLCAALSAMTMLIVNAVEISYSSDVEYTIDEKTTNIKVIIKSALADYEPDERKSYAISGLIKAYYYQLNDLIEEYYDYLEVDVIDNEVIS